MTPANVKACATHMTGGAAQQLRADLVRSTTVSVVRMQHHVPCLVVWALLWHNPAAQQAVLPRRHVCCRKRNGIDARASVSIKLAEEDIYIAHINDKLVVKLGPRGDTPPHLVPQEQEGWKVAATGRDFCIWEKK